MEASTVPNAKRNHQAESRAQEPAALGKAIRVTEPNQVTIARLPDPEPGDQELLIRVMASGICGTDVHILRGEYLEAYPVVPGHEFSGVVERVGTKVTRFGVGDRVAVEPNIACDNCANCLHNRQNFCLNWEAIGVTRPGGMAQTVLAPEKAVFSIGDLSFEQAAFMEPLSCVLHGIEQAGVGLADRIAILGAGPIGNLLLQVARLQGAAHVTVMERQPARADLARTSGADRCLVSLDALEEDHYDLVIDATGSISVMARAIDYARHGGTVLLFGVLPAGAVMEVEPFKIFRKGLTVLSSFTSRRNSYQAVSLLRSGLVDVKTLISHRLPLEQFERGVALIEQGLEDVRKVMILPQE
jgi:2-desacetyl-2-hydroxyethyl bacteriochlorophyllide A dehydrogenase